MSTNTDYLSRLFVYFKKTIMLQTGNLFQEAGHNIDSFFNMMINFRGRKYLVVKTRRWV